MRGLPRDGRRGLASRRRAQRAAAPRSRATVSYTTSAGAFKESLVVNRRVLEVDLFTIFLEGFSPEARLQASLGAVFLAPEYSHQSRSVETNLSSER